MDSIEYFKNKGGFKGDITKYENPLAGAKSKNFNAGVNGHNFQRYASQYDKIGFNPHKDMEKEWNTKVGAWGDISRSLAGASQLAGLGFKAALPFSSIWKDSIDTSEASQYDKINAIHSSSKGGMTGFISNTALSAGYTVGIIGEAVAEEIALWGAAALTGGIGAGGAAVETGLVVGRAADKISKAWKFEKFTNTIKKAGQTIDRIRELSTVEGARAAYQATLKGTVSLGKGLAKSVAGNTIDYAKNYGKIDDALKFRKGAASVWKDYRAFELAHGESGLEAGMVKNQIMDREYEKIAKEGREVTAEDNERITKMANDAATSTYWANLPTIALTNSITLAPMMNKFKPLRNLDVSDVANRAGKITFGKIKKGIKKGDLNIARVTTGTGGAIKRGIQNLADPKAYLKGLAMYTKENFTEGAQEILQETISAASIDYYTRLNDSKSKVGVMDSILAGYNKMAENGLETFASGFIMGGMTKPVGTVISTVQSNAYRVMDREGYQRDIDALNKQAEAYNEVINKMPSVFSSKLDNLSVNEHTTAGMRQADSEGNSKKYYDMKNANFMHQMDLIIRSGQTDQYKKMLNDMKSFSQEELQEAFPDFDKDVDIHRQIDKYIENIDGFKKQHEDVTKILGDNPYKIDGIEDKESDEYKLMEKKHYGFESAKRSLIFMQGTFINNVDRLDKISKTLSSVSGAPNITNMELQSLLTPNGLIASLSNLHKEVAMVENDVRAVTPEMKALVKQKKEKIKTMERFMGIRDEILELESKEEELTDKEKNKLKKLKEHGAAALGRFIKNETDHNYYENKESLLNGFNAIMDYHTLSDEARLMNDAVNKLYDPNHFMYFAKAEEKTAEYLNENRKELALQAIKRFKADAGKNQILSDLSDQDIFFDPLDLDELMNEGIMPRKLFNGEGKEILYTSEEYNNAVNIIKDGFDVINKLEDDESKHIVLKNIYVAGIIPGIMQEYQIQYKADDDTRTLEQLANEFDFSSTGETKVSTQDVLNKMLASNFIADTDKLLIKQLLKNLKPDSVITFTTNPKVVEVNGNEIIIDPKYASYDYADATQVGLEYLILKGVTLTLINDEFINSEELNDLFNSVKEKIYKDNNINPERNFTGLRDTKDFVSEILSNKAFALNIARITSPTNADTNSLSDFANMLLDHFKANGISSNNALNTLFDVLGATMGIGANVETVNQAQEEKSKEEERKKINQDNFEILLNSISDIESYREALEQMYLLVGTDPFFLLDIGGIDKRDESFFKSKILEKLKETSKLKEEDITIGAKIVRINKDGSVYLKEGRIQYFVIDQIHDDGIVLQNSDGIFEATNKEKMLENNYYLYNEESEEIINNTQEEVKPEDVEIIINSKESDEEYMSNEEKEMRYDLQFKNNFFSNFENNC